MSDESELGAFLGKCIHFLKQYKMHKVTFTVDKTTNLGLFLKLLKTNL